MSVRMKKSTKIKLIIISAVILALGGYVTYLFVHYFNYMEYRKYLKKYPYEEGREFTAENDSDPKVEGMVLVAENDVLKLYTNTATTEVAVYDKRSGEITYSNPVNRAEDIVAAGVNKAALNSQFMLTYYDMSMVQVDIYNYDYSIERKQFRIEKIGNGIRYIYLLGNLDNPTGLVPPIITMERLQEKILSKLSSKEAKFFRNCYMDSQTKEGFLEITQGTLINKVGLQKMNKYCEKAGYTLADYEEDAKAAGTSSGEKITFTVELEYRLDKDTLKVTIPTSKIKETGGGKLAYIKLLSFFGAGGPKETGYMLVPNGTGSLINFNNGKNSEPYNQFVYGMDESLSSPTVVEVTEKVRLPVFGIKHEKSAVFAEITSGESLVNIIAEVAGSRNSYNYVYPTFSVRGLEYVSMFEVSGASSDMPTVEKNMYKLDLTVSYTILEQKNASYSGMAEYYRNKLIERGGLAVKEKSDSIPFYLDILQGVKMQKSILGVTYLGIYPMTTFKEADKIIDAFRENGVSDLRVNLLGWFNGGYYHDVAKNIKVDQELGGKKDLKAFNNKLKKVGIKLYGDVAIQKVSFESDHYDYKKENAKYYSGINVMTGRVNPASMRINSFDYFESLYDVLSPKFLVRHVKSFLNALKKVDITGVSLRDMGDMVASDRKMLNVINRQESEQVVTGQLDIIKEKAGNVMISGGNAYSFTYADDLENVPSGHNPFYIVDEEVPFYQMVIHGCVDYSAAAVNLSDSYDKQDIILRLIELGMSPHFTLTYKESSRMKYSGCNDLYSTQYTVWLADAAEIYSKTNDVLKHVTNSTVKEHLILQTGVKKVTYDNGCVIYINYTDNEVRTNEVTIPARGCLLEEKG